MENSLFAVSIQRSNELIAEASALLVKERSLRLGQALVNCMNTDDNPEPWPELFNEESPAKAIEIFYSRVENKGERKLTGKIDMSLLRK